MASPGLLLPKEEACFNCGKAGAAKRCIRCRAAVYCSKECQRGAWKEHKKICGKVARPALDNVKAQMQNLKTFDAEQAGADDKDVVPFTQYMILGPDIASRAVGASTQALEGGQLAWQVVNAGGPLGGEPLGFFPARILEARAAVQPSMINIARSQFDRKIIGGYMRRTMPEREAKRLSRTFDKQDASQRADACGLLANTLWPWACGMYHLGCANNPGGGAIAIEGSSAMKLVIRGLHDHSRFVPVLAAFLTWEQLERWQAAVCRGIPGYSEAELAQMAKQQVDVLRHSKTPGQDCPVKFSIATRDLLPMDISLDDRDGTGDNPQEPSFTDRILGRFPDAAERSPGRAAGFKKHVEILLTLGNVNVLRWDAADTLDAFDIFGASNIDADGKTTPLDTPGSLPVDMVMAGNTVMSVPRRNSGDAVGSTSVQVEKRALQGVVGDVVPTFLDEEDEAAARQGPGDMDALAQVFASKGLPRDALSKALSSDGSAEALAEAFGTGVSVMQIPDGLEAGLKFVQDRRAMAVDVEAGAKEDESGPVSGAAGTASQPAKAAKKKRGGKKKGRR